MRHPCKERFTVEQMKNQPIIREALRAHGVDPKEVEIPVTFRVKQEPQSEIPTPYIFLDERSGCIDWGHNHFIFSYQFSTSAYTFYMSVWTELLPESLLNQINRKILSDIIDLPGTPECIIIDSIEVGEKTALILADSARDET